MHHSKAHIWFVWPAIILMIVILILPIFLAGGISFTNYNLGNSSFEWVGTENYEKMFSRKTYIKMIISTATYVLIVVPVSVVFLVLCMLGYFASSILVCGISVNVGSRKH